MTLEVRCGAANPDAQRKRDPAAVARNQAAYGKFSAIDPAAGTQPPIANEVSLQLK